MRTLTGVLGLATLASCDGGGAGASGSADARADNSAPATATPIRTADTPADACGWISAAEVAAIIGPLEGPPRVEDGDCLYPVPLDAESVRRRAAAEKMGEFAKQLAEKMGEKYEPIEDTRPTESAVIVGVELEGKGMEQSTMAATEAMMASWAGVGASPEDTKKPPPPEGWDEVRSSIVMGLPGYWGRLGHVDVTVRPQAVIVPHEKLATLAAAVRGKIPDLPFAYPGPGSSNAGRHDPCSLVTAQEAEAVLGKLVAPPYRSHEATPLAEAHGPSCTYLTSGHHALVLTPTWEYGGMTVEAIRSVSGILGSIVPGLNEVGADTLDGDWEEAGSDRTTGQFYFLKGERLLELGYLQSSTDADGAVRLARIAMGRL